MITRKSNYLRSINILSIAVIVYSFSGCKKPDANYILNKFEYSAGDMLLVENLSINNKETKWEVVSSKDEIMQTSKLKNPSLILGMMSPDGYYTLRLTSYSRKEKKSSVEEKPFMIKSLRTYLSINHYLSGDHENYLVYVDNQFIGESNSSGKFQAKIPLGYRIVKLVSGSVEKTESIVFEENLWNYINF